MFPDIKWISTDTISQTQLQILVWMNEALTDRSDLAIPLGECGTGVGQALAILYVVVSSDEPRSIIIDEPQSFLHPGAAKKLVEILKSYGQHQYFISTHSPDILRVANPSTITSLHLENSITVAGSLGIEDTNKIGEVLNDIGVSVNDVLFPQYTIWVEGPTESSSLPLVIEHFGDRTQLADIKVLPVINVDDLRGKRNARKHSRLVFKIYKDLSGAGAVVSPILGMILDPEGTSAAEVAELRHISEGLVDFLPRRLYENYLLDPEAIASVFNKKASLYDNDNVISSAEVKEWIDRAKQERKYLEKGAKEAELSSVEWLVKVHGAHLLEDLFYHFSKAQMSFEKPSDSTQLTSWLLENKPELLKEVWEIIKQALDRKR